MPNTETIAPAADTPTLDQIREIKAAKIVMAHDALVEALVFYADPASYFALTVLNDPPNGDFANDFGPLTTEDEDYFDGYREKGADYYGKKARQALAEWRKAREL